MPIRLTSRIMAEANPYAFCTPDSDKTSTISRRCKESQSMHNELQPHSVLNGTEQVTLPVKAFS